MLVLNIITSIILIFGIGVSIFELMSYGFQMFYLLLVLAIFIVSYVVLFKYSLIDIGIISGESEIEKEINA